jgi:hypothetical protein
MGKIVKIALFQLLVGGLLFPQDNGASIRKALVDTAKKYLGVPYVYGAESPEAFDCSGFVQYVYKKAAGLSIPRSSKQIWFTGRPVDVSSATTGDVLVFDTVGGAPSHVALILDRSAIIHAVSEGPKTGVIVSPVQDRYFGPRILGARVFIPDQGPQEPQKGQDSLKPQGEQSLQRDQGQRQGQKDQAPQKGQSPPPSSVSPGKPSPQASEEVPVSTIGFTITNEPVLYTDKIPALVGSALQYAVTNGTGKDGIFEILFYKMDLDPAKAKTLRQDRITIKAGEMIEVDPYTFTEPGQYKLILKTYNNLKRVERVWKVVGDKR